MWERLNLTDERIKGGEYSTLIHIGDRDYLKVTNKLVKRDGYGRTYLIYKDGFTFDLFHVGYGRFGKRHDEWVRKVDSSELTRLFEEYIQEPDLPLPEVTGKALEELLDD